MGPPEGCIVVATPVERPGAADRAVDHGVVDHARGVRRDDRPATDRVHGAVHARAAAPEGRPAHKLTFPSLMPVFALDRFYLRGLVCRTTMVPRGVSWARMSDHLPMVAELEPG